MQPYTSPISQNEINSVLWKACDTCLCHGGPIEMQTLHFYRVLGQVLV
jgi:hypothetical protein